MNSSLFDALRLSDDACAEIWQKTSRNILSQWSRDRIAKERLTPGVRALVLAAKDNRRPTRIRRALLMCACYYDWHGIDGVMRRLLHGPSKDPLINFSDNCPFSLVTCKKERIVKPDL